MTTRFKYGPERLWDNLDKSGDCWIWKGSKVSGGYGSLCYHGVPWRAHVLAYRFTHGVWPERDQFICHRCDNPPCCNPDHLFLGTAKDNARDMVAKGRHPAQRYPELYPWLNRGNKVA